MKKEIKSTLNNKITEIGFKTMNIISEDGADVTCVIEKTFEVRKQNYIALMPITDNGDALEDEPLFYHCRELDGAQMITEITDEDEYDMVADRYDEMLDEEEFDRYEE